MNTFAMLAQYFSIPGKPITSREFALFWNALSEAEKHYYRNVDLEMGRGSRSI